jgi:hypothetical protein
VQGIQGIKGDSGVQGATGAQGNIGLTGLQGIKGDSGVQGATGATGASGITMSGLYVQLGAQPATIAAGLPFTFSTTALASGNITSTTTGGTVFTLASVGRYEVNYQLNFATDGGVVLYLGTTLGGMVPLAYTMIGKTPNGSIFGSVIIETTSPNSFVSINAAAGNAIAIPPNSSTTNQSATTVSFKKLN